MNCSDDFVGLSKLSTALAIKGSLKLFNLVQFVESGFILVGFETQKGNISLDFASLRVMKGIIVFINPLYDSETVKSTLRLVIFILIITKSHHYLGKIIRILILLKIIEDFKRSLLRFDSLIKILSFCIDFGHL